MGILTEGVKIKIGGDNKEFKKTASDVVSTLKNLKKEVGEVGNAFVSMRNVIATLTLGYGVKKIAESFIDAAKQMASFERQLKGLLGTQQAANQVMMDSERYAMKMGQRIDIVTASSVQLAQVVEGGTEAIRDWLPVIGDMAAALGKSFAEANDLFTRLYTRGTAALRYDIAMRKQMGIQPGEDLNVTQTMEKFLTAWKTKWKGAAAETAKGWDALVNSFYNTMERLRETVMSAGVFDELKKQLKSMGDEFERWFKSNESFIRMA